MNGEPLSLAEWLRAAWADPAAGCPPPEVWLADELAALSPAERDRLEAHAATCPACAGERELARAFDAGAEAADPADLAWVVSRLEAQAPAGTGPAATGAATAAVTAKTAAGEPSGNAGRGRLVAFPGRRVVRWVRLAAAAVLVVAAGLVFQTLTFSPSPLPEPPDAGVVRGGRVEVAAPAGELAELPAALGWRAVAGAAAYRVHLLGAGDDVLWRAEVAGPPAPLPAEIMAELHRAVSYHWYVEALAADGTVLGRSETVRFRATPEPEAETEDGR